MPSPFDDLHEGAFVLLHFPVGPGLRIAIVQNLKSSYPYEDELCMI